MSTLEDLLPVPDDASRPFFDGAREGRLMLQRCAGCAQSWFPVRKHCAICNGHEIDWIEATGRGQIYMHGRMRQVFHPELADSVPYRLAIVELEEGARMLTQLVETPDEQIKVGARVEVTFEQLTDEVSLPKFRIL